MNQITLNPFQGVVRNDATPKFSLLICGDAGTGKKTLGRALLSRRSSTAVDVRTSTRLPLPVNEKRPRIDFIVMLVSMRSRGSLEAAREVFASLHRNYLFGGVALVATCAESPAQYAFPLNKLIECAEEFQVDLLLTNLMDSRKVDSLVRSLLTLGSRAAGHRHGVSPLLMDSLNFLSVPAH